MKLKALLADDDAVSPVIGVILMVAITVILAAVIGTFVLGLGGQVSDSSPTANWDFTFDDASNMTVTHDGGDQLDDSTLSIKVGNTLAYEGSGATGGASSADIKDAFNNSAYASDNWGSSGITSGDQVALSSSDGTPTNTTTHNGDTVRVIWSSSSGGDTATIGEREWSA